MTINTMQEQGKQLILKYKSMKKKNKELIKVQDNQNDLIKTLSIDMAKMVGENRELKDENSTLKE